MTASVYYLPFSGHCCACSRVCWHTSPASYCHRHSVASWWWVSGTNHITTGTNTWASTPYVGRHRKGDPEAGA